VSASDSVYTLQSEDDLLRALSVPPNDVSPLLSDDQLPACLPLPLSPSPLGLRRRNILRERKRARECLTDQAERVVFELQAGNIGNIVALPVPMVDKGTWTLATSRSHHRQERKRPLHHCHTTRHPV